MDDFRVPNTQPMSHYAQEIDGGFADLRRPWGWPFSSTTRNFQSRNTASTPSQGDRAPAGNAAQIVPHDNSLQARRIPRLWNPALRCAPNPWGAASNGVKYADNMGSLVWLPTPDRKGAVLMKLNLWYNRSIRALAGQPNARPFQGGSGSTENVRIPPASTLGAF